MATPEEIKAAKDKIAEIAQQKRAQDEATRPRTYTERLQDMGRLPKGGGTGSAEGVSGGDGLLKNEISAKNPVYKKGGSVQDKYRNQKLVKGFEGQKTSMTRVFNGTVVRGHGIESKGRTKGRFV